VKFDGESVLEHLARVEDFKLALAAYLPRASVGRVQPSTCVKVIALLRTALHGIRQSMALPTFIPGASLPDPKIVEDRT
jgi:hypothetical protein